MTSGERCDFLHYGLLPPPPRSPGGPARPAAFRPARRAPAPAVRPGFAHRPGGRPRPGLALLVALLLLGAAAGVTSHLLRQPDPAGINLQTDRSSSMLRDTSAGAPPKTTRPAPRKDLDRQAHDEQAAAPPPPRPAPMPSVPEPPPVLPALEPPPAPPAPLPGPVTLAAASEPPEAACSGNCVSPRGVSPMLRNWRMFVLPSFVLVALSTPAPALGGGEKKQNAAQDRLKPVLEQFDRLKESLQEDFGKVARDITDLKKEVKGLREERGELQAELQRQISDLKTDLDALKKRLPADVRLYPEADKGALEEIRSRLAQIEGTLSRLQSQNTRVAMSAPDGRTGRIQLVNSYPSEMLFVINGQSHRVDAGATLAVEGVPAGDVTYEAIAPNWGTVRRNTTTLAAGETLTLVAR